MRFKLGIAGIFLVLALSLYLVSAVPGIPHQIYGSVSVDGEPVPDGIIISATCGGDTYQTTSSGGNFGYSPNVFYIEDPTGDKGIYGEEIEVYVNNIKVEEMDFERGGLTELNIQLSRFCGDAICSSGEDCSSCSEDCGSCPTDGGGTTGGGGGGGSSGGKRKCIENWQCSEWSDVAGACGTRTCTDNNNCDTTLLKPDEKRDCKKETGEQIIVEEEKGSISRLTGAVIGGGTAKILVPIIFIILVGVVYILVLYKKKRK